MTKTKAIAKARREVTVCRFGRDYVVHTWDEHIKMTRVSHPMAYSDALAAAASAKLAAALTYMGWEPREAKYASWDRTPGIKWEELVKKSA